MQKLRCTEPLRQRKMLVGSMEICRSKENNQSNSIKNWVPESSTDCRRVPIPLAERKRETAEGKFGRLIPVHASPHVTWSLATGRGVSFCAQGVLVDGQLPRRGHAAPLVALQRFPDGALFHILQRAQIRRERTNRLGRYPSIRASTA